MFMPQSEGMPQFMGHGARGAAAGDWNKLDSSGHSDVRLAGRADDRLAHDDDIIRLARKWQNLKRGAGVPLRDPIRNRLRIRDARADRIVDDAVGPELWAGRSEHLMQ